MTNQKIQIIFLCQNKSNTIKALYFKDFPQHITERIIK